MEYLYIGAIGIAQVGTPDYQTLSIKEGNFLLDYFKRNYPIPKDFPNASFVWRSNPHDFGSYYSLDLKYNVSELEKMSQELQDAFWEYFNVLEGVNIEGLQEEFEKSRFSDTDIDTL